MSDAKPVFNQVNLVVSDIDASRSFYERLGVRMNELPEWPPGSGARHVEAEQAASGEIHFDLDNPQMARIWHEGVRADPSIGGPVLSFSFPSRQAVEERYADLVAAGYASRQEPYDTFWGSRYAIGPRAVRGDGARGDARRPRARRRDADGALLVRGP